MAFVSFALLLASLVAARAYELEDAKRALVESLILLMPAILILWEIVIFFLECGEFYVHVMGFIGKTRLSDVVTNANVLFVAAALLVTKLAFLIVRKKTLTIARR